MPPIKPRRYYQYVERETYKISLKWKALHALIFLLIVITSFLAAYTFHHILHMFSFRCVLYARPHLTLRNIEYHTTTETTEVAIEFENITTVSNTTDFLNNNNKNSYVETSNVSYLEIRKGRYWVNNATLTAQVAIEMTKTVFTSPIMCDLVLCSPLIGMIIAVFFCALVIVCGRGGRGYITDITPQSWLYVYPVLIVASTMLIHSFISSSTVSRGLRQFCSEFQEYTGEESCTKLMNHFAYHERILENFYGMYMTCIYSFRITIILWIAQLILTVLRVLCVVDFQLKSILVRSKKHDAFHDDEKIVNEALMKQYPGLTEAKTTLDEDLNQTDTNEVTTQV